jgi:hypothetical protein
MLDPSARNGLPAAGLFSCGDLKTSFGQRVAHCSDARRLGGLLERVAGLTSSIVGERG